MELIYDKLKNIKAFVFDVDGVMTDGSVIATEDGYFLRSFNIKDGYAIQHAVKNNYHIAIISGGKSAGVIKRFEILGVTDIYVGQDHKLKAFNEFTNKYNLKNEEILYMGDDMPDYPLLQMVGFSTCPADAAIDVKKICQYVSPLDGGKGCVRDIIEKTMKIQEKWWGNETHKW
ncbi:MAG: HAD-IIIA family hydrolase [Bacteroidota bacterium]|nr:HAD-IIIA family hydrolase [Bacteroidota bacterium]